MDPRHGGGGHDDPELAPSTDPAVDDRLAELTKINRDTPHLFTRAMEDEQTKLIEAKMSRKPVWV